MVLSVPMTLPVDVWLRGQDTAITQSIDVSHDPRVWTDDDVRAVLEGMLRAMHRLKHPDEAARAVALRGLSWIVSPYEDGGVVIAIEITMGAAIAGPLDINRSALETMISRVLRGPELPSSDRVH